jgi:hypothetical protein
MFELLSVLLIIFGWSVIFYGLFISTEKDIDRKREQYKRIEEKKQLLNK